MDMSSLSIISHFYNEESFLPYFIKHHLPLADQVIMINHKSTDNSVDIIRELAPEWKIVDTGLSDFNASLNDREVEKWEATLNTEFKFTLNLTEFIFTHDFKNKLMLIKEQNPGVNAFAMRSVVLVDKEENDRSPDWREHTYGYVDNEYVTRRRRFVHCREHGHYELGRHGTKLNSIDIPEFMLLWMGWAPYPKCLERKKQILAKMPIGDVQSNLGLEHIKIHTAGEQMYQDQLSKSYDLFTNDQYRQYYEALK